MDCTLWTIKTTTRAPNNANNDVLHLSKRGPAASIRWRGRSVSAPSHTFQPWFNLFRENRNPQTPVSQPAFWNEKFLHQLDIKTSHEKKSISITSNTLLQPSYSRQTQIMYQHQIKATSTTCGMFFFQSGKFGVCQKHRKNCKCCPGHYLNVNRYSSMSWFNFRNLSVISQLCQ